MQERSRGTDGPADDQAPAGARPTHSAQDVRQGEIILRTRRRRWIFFGGLVAAVIVALILASLT